MQWVTAMTCTSSPTPRGASLEKHTTWQSAASWPRGPNRLRGLAWPASSSAIGRGQRASRRSVSSFANTQALPALYSHGRCSCYRPSKSRAPKGLSCRRHLHSSGFGGAVRPRETVLSMGRLSDRDMLCRSLRHPTGLDLARGEILDDATLGTVRSPHPKASLADFQRPNLPFERRTRNPESGRRSQWPEHASAARAQGIFDDRLLVCGQRPGQAKPAIDRVRLGQPALVDGEFVGVGDDHRPLDDVLQLTHVPGPSIGLQAVGCPLADPPECLTRLAGVGTDEVLHEHGNVFLPIP